MLWPTLFFVSLALTMGLHWAWRRRCARLQLRWESRVGQLRGELTAERGELLARQDTLLNSMTEGILMLDGGGNIRIVNPAFRRLFQLSGDLTGRPLLEVLRRHELSELATATGRGERVLGYELHLAGPQELWLLVNVSPLITGGQYQGALFVFHDVTQLKKLETSRRDFVANVSHELRTPLSLIKGGVETLLEGAKDQPETADKFLRSIERNAERLRMLVEDLLTIAQLESGAARLEFAPVQLGALTRKVCDDLRPRAALRRVSIVAEVPEIMVRGDAGRLEQVFCNLLDNAIKYGREGGTVNISARATAGGKEIEIWVADDGPGIPRESLERVFERFYRVDRARSREQGGTGLGLAIVKHIVLSHNGRIWAESGPGQGATFKFTLPAAV